MKKALVSLSGGMDSATVLAKALDEGRMVRAVGFSYGSKHNQWENAAAIELVNHYRIPFELIDLAGVMRSFRSNLLQSGPAIPEGFYEAESMRQTVVPGRNLIFIAVLAGLAESLGLDEVWLGAHSGDHHIYPDCRPTFIRAADEAIHLSSDGRVLLETPFLSGNKTTILQEGFHLGVPYGLTRTCYCDTPIACGKCGSCQERLDAFAKNGIEDPLEYQSRVLFPKPE